jgi:hypothetical protein
MEDFQKNALGVIFAVIIVFAWIAMLFMKQFVDGFEVSAELQGLAVAIVVLVVGISTPIGPAVGKGLKKIAGGVRKGIS